MKRRTKTRLLIAGATVGGALIAVYLAAEADMARERAARRYLGDQLYTEIRGDGDPIVFIAGLQGSTRYWGSAFDTFSSHHRLIFVDALGFGRSPWPEHIDYDLDDQVAALRRTLVAKGATKKVTLVAHSFGTLIAAGYGSRYPDELSRLVLLGTPVFDSPRDARDRIRTMSALGAVFSFNETLASLSCMTMCAFRPALRRLLPRLRRDLDPEVVADSVLHDLPAFRGSMNNLLMKVRIADLLPNVGSRTILVHGNRDPVTPIADVRRLAEESGAALIETGGDHHSYLGSSLDDVFRALEVPVVLKGKQ